MSKAKSVYTCQICGYQSPKWLGKCSDCGNWNSMMEEVSSSNVNPFGQKISGTRESPVAISKVSIKEETRTPSGIEEFDRILGGGLVKGSVVLIGGAPGIGKSTLLMQISESFAGKKSNVLYISAEESIKQAKLRAERVGTRSDNIYIVNQTNINAVIEFIKKLKPDIVIIDSIQALYRPELNSIPGSVSQVRDCAGELTYLAKNKGISLFLVGHITKSGMLAGPKILEHMVDTVLYFEGEQHYNFRILRSIKNRFGATNEVGIFEMASTGLKEIKNPSDIFISERTGNVSGSVIVPTIEGSRPILVEIQALVSYSGYAQAARRTTGLDYNKVNLLIAVLEKRARLKLGNKDVYVNVAGGVKITEPASDLAVIIAVASSLKDAPVNKEMVAFGEVGLSGEVRAVSQAAARIEEARRLGFKRCIMPKANLKGLSKKYKDIKIEAHSNIHDVLASVIKK